MKINYINIPLITILIALLGGKMTSSSVDTWYKIIRLPSWTPSGKIIGLVWTIIFILTTISLLIIWNKFNNIGHFKTILGLFALNAFLNLSWSYIFFVKHNIFLAFIDTIFLELSVLSLIFFIYPTSQIAAALLIPYSLWVIFASFLNYNIWKLNS